MRVETRKKLILTKAERKTICDLYEIFKEDLSIDVYGVRDILTDIYEGVDGEAQQYGYNIDIID